MTDRMSLTAAEVAYLLSTVDTDGTSPTSSLLGLTEADRTDAVLEAGLGSLALRGLLVAEDDVIQLSPIAAVIAEGLAHPQLSAEMGLIADGTVDGAYFFDTGQIRLLVGPRMFRCFDVTGLDSSDDFVTALVDVARAFLTDNRPGVAAVETHAWTVDGERARPASKASVAVSDGDEWTFVRESDSDLAAPVPTADAAWRLLADALAPDGRSSPAVRCEAG